MDDLSITEMAYLLQCASVALALAGICIGIYALHILFAIRKERDV